MISRRDNSQHQASCNDVIEVRVRRWRLISCAWSSFGGISPLSPPVLTGVVITIASTAEIGGGGGEKQRLKPKKR